MTILNSASFKRDLDRHLQSRYHLIGKKIVDKIILLSYDSFRDKIDYQIEDDTIKIVSSSPVPLFLDQGTKPHIIRAKPGKTLAFRTQENVTRKDGSVLKTGDWVFTPEVKHPGIEAKMFVSQAIYLTKKEFPNLLFDKSPPTSRQ